MARGGLTVAIEVVDNDDVGEDGSPGVVVEPGEAAGETGHGGVADVVEDPHGVAVCGVPAARPKEVQVPGDGVRVLEKNHLNKRINNDNPYLGNLEFKMFL